MRERPYRAPIAHGYLTLALVAPPTDAGAAFNYGLDKVRFLAPVKAGDRVRLRVALVNVEQKSGGVLLKTSKPSRSKARTSRRSSLSCWR